MGHITSAVIYITIRKSGMRGTVHNIVYVTLRGEE
jgi:hypothetical protein